MKRKTQEIGTAGIALLAGLMDSATGLLLMAAPLFTLRLMGIDPPAEALPYVRFIGAFVFAVGNLYLWSLLSVKILETWKALFCLFYATGWIRAVICVQCLVAILAQTLSLEWGTVVLTDGGLALTQFIWLMKGGIPRHG